MTGARRSTRGLLPLYVVVFTGFLGYSLMITVLLASLAATTLMYGAIALALMSGSLALLLALIVVPSSKLSLWGTLAPTALFVAICLSACAAIRVRERDAPALGRG